MAKTEHPPARLNDILRYDSDTGNFRWLIRTHGGGRLILPGDIAGTPKDGYISLTLGKVNYRAHRIAWYVMTGDWLPSSQDIDHINRNRSDNRWCNLRLKSRSENNLNSEKAPNSKSGVRGVHWVRKTNRWQARIVVDGILYELGQFDDFTAAIAARRAAEFRLLGENAVSNYRVPTQSAYVPAITLKTGLTLEGKARRVAVNRQSRNAEGRYAGVKMNAKGDKWIARICLGMREVFLGTFDTYDEAVAARKRAEAEHHAIT